MPRYRQSLFRLDLQSLAHPLSIFLQTLLIGLQCRFQAHLRLPRRCGDGLRLLHLRIGLAQFALGQSQRVSRLLPLCLSLCHQIGQLGAALSEIIRHMLIADQFFFAGRLPLGQGFNMIPCRLFSLRPLLAIISQSLHPRIAGFAARFQTVKRTTFFTMGEPCTFHITARRFNRLQKRVLPAEMSQIAIGGFVAIAQLIQIGGDAF